MNTQKKTLEITGHPIYPITVGELAWIQEQNGIRRTTSVVRLEKPSSSEVHFETRNTRYVLHLAELNREVCAG